MGPKVWERASLCVEEEEPRLVGLPGEKWSERGSQRLCYGWLQAGEPAVRWTWEDQLERGLWEGCAGARTRVLW